MDPSRFVDLLEFDADEFQARGYDPTVALLDMLDDDLDDDSLELYEALEALGPSDAERAWNAALHPRAPKGTGKGGEFVSKNSILGKLTAAIEKWAGDSDDIAVFDGYSREQLRKVATKRGLTFKKGASREDIAKALLADLHERKAKSPKKGVLSPPTGKFELLPKDQQGKSGDGYAPGGQWGKYGAAGVLIQSTASGEPRYLLVQRGPGVSNNKGKWQLPGGALNEHENPYQGAARETLEEVGASEDYVTGLTPVGESVYTHDATGWQYTTIAASSPTEFDPTVDGSETSDAKWVSAAEIADMQANGDLVPKLDKSLLPIVESYPNHKGKADVKTKPSPAKAPATTPTVDPTEALLQALMTGQAPGKAPAGKGKSAAVSQAATISDSSIIEFDLHGAPLHGHSSEHLNVTADGVLIGSVHKNKDDGQWVAWPPAGQGSLPLGSGGSKEVATVLLIDYHNHGNKTVPTAPSLNFEPKSPMSSQPGSTGFSVSHNGVDVGHIEQGGTSGQWTAFPPSGAGWGLKSGPGSGASFDTPEEAGDALAKASEVHAAVQASLSTPTGTPPAGAKKVAINVAGIAGVTQVSKPPKYEHGSTAKQSLDIYFGGSKVGELHLESYGYWTSRDADGKWIGHGGSTSKTKALHGLLDAHTKGQIAKLDAKKQAELATKADAAKKAADAAAAAKKAEIKAALKRSSKPTADEARVYGGDFTHLTRVGAQGGSNEGGIFETPDGSRWYVKVQKSKQHADNEKLASTLYGLAGIETPEIFSGTGTPGLSGEHHTATRMLPDAAADLKDRIKGAAKGDKADRAYVRKAQEGFAVDAWLGNWDVAGQNFDNIVTSADDPTRIDVGGALLYRAQGAPKGSRFGAVVTEWDTFLDPNATLTSSALFDTMAPERIVASANRLKPVTPAKIRAAVKAADMPPELADTLIARRKDILSRAKQLEKIKKAFGEGALKGKPAQQSAHVSLKNLASTLQGLGVSHEQAQYTDSAVNSYKGSGYGDINRYLLGSGASAGAKKKVADMDVAFEHSTLSADVIVYRGERDPSRNFPPGEWSLVGGMEGKEWTFKSFASASVDKHTAESFSLGGSKGATAQPTVMRLVVPEGTRAIDLVTEGELLLDRDLRYRVVADHGVDNIGIRRIDVMVVL